MRKALVAELIRTKSSSAAWITLTGLIFALLSSGFAETVKLSGDVHALLNWQGLYATGLAGPVMTLIAGLVWEREKNAREGGTSWRSARRAQVIVARVLVVWGLSLLFHCLTYGGILGVALLNGFSGSLGIIASAGIISWIASAAWCIPGLLVARWVGAIPAVLISVVLQGAGTVVAEKSWWWAVPMSWPIRPCLWVLGIHQNAVLLQPGEEPLIHEPWSALSLCVVAAVAATAGLIWSDAHNPSMDGVSLFTRWGKEKSRSARGGVWGAIDLAVRGGAIRYLTVSSLLALVIIAISHRPGVTSGLFSYAILPLGSMILPVLAWSKVRDGWQLVSLRSAAAWWVFTLRLVLHVVLMVVFATGFVMVEGDSEGLLRRVILWVLTGTVMVLLSLVVAVRFSAGVAVGGALIWWIFSVTFAGDILAVTPLWVVSLPLWAECANTPGRLLIAMIACGVLAGALIGLWRRVENRSLRSL